jgi:uncharacterized protein involved in tolerance to divalent cations
MMMKSRISLQEEIVDAILKIHPYRNPEIISLPIMGGSQKYI